MNFMRGKAKMKCKALVSVLFLFVMLTTVGFAKDILTDDLVCTRKITFSDYMSFISDFMGRPLRTTPCFSCHDRQGFSGFEVPAPVPRTGQSTSYVPGDDGDTLGGIE